MWGQRTAAGRDECRVPLSDAWSAPSVERRRGPGAGARGNVGGPGEDVRSCSHWSSVQKVWETKPVKLRAGAFR